MKRLWGSIFLICFVFTQIYAQHFEVNKSSFEYKKVNGTSLEMVMYKPEMPTEMQLPAICLFFGGGWVSGDPSHFQLQAEYLASRGIVVFCPDYRTKKRHNTTPFESVKDAKSAMRYLKTHGTELGIDTSRIVAGGGSAGGHLAACTATITEINEETDNLSVSSEPYALVLFNPVVDTGKKGYGQEKLDGREFEISPVHHISPGMPPTLIMHGKSDSTVPYENVVRFKQIMKQEGNQCFLKGYAKQTHGFFNYNKKPKYFKKTLQKTEGFLDDLNLLKGGSWSGEYVKGLK